MKSLGDAESCDAHSYGVSVTLGNISISVRSLLPDVVRDFSELYSGRTCSAPRCGATIRMEVGRSRRSLLGSRRYAICGDGERIFTDRRRLELLPYLEWAINRRVIARQSAYLQIHAATMAHGRCGFVFAGNSGTGKSTLAAGLLSRKWRYFCDEFALIDQHAVRIHPFPKALCVKAGSFEVVRRLDLPLQTHPFWIKAFKGPVGYIDPNAASAEVADLPVQVRFVVFPKYVSGGATRLFPVSRGRAVFALRQHTFNADVLGPRTLSILSRMVRGADCFGLEYGRLEDACNILETLL